MRAFPSGWLARKPLEDEKGTISMTLRSSIDRVLPVRAPNGKAREKLTQLEGSVTCRLHRSDLAVRDVQFLPGDRDVAYMYFICGLKV